MGVLVIRIIPKKRLKNVGNIQHPSKTHMTCKNNVFEQTYNDYLKKISAINLASLTDKLGAKYKEEKLSISLFQKEYTVSDEGIIDSSGERPSLDICVILSKYILSCPENQLKSSSGSHEWVSYRNLKDSAPLHHYFTNEVEKAISFLFSERLQSLQEASERLGGYLPSLDVNYDFAVQFDALPKVPLILLYNTPDEEFPANCSILLTAQSEQYLDCESIALLGRQLYSHLKKLQKIITKNNKD